MKKLLISGGDGKFSSLIKKYNDKYDIIAPPKKEMDITEINQIEKFIVHNKIDIFLHAAALTRPMGEHIDNPSASIKINIIGTCNVVLTCIKYGIKLVYISTDYVYPGVRGGYKEGSPLLPVNNYAWSKLGGECAVKLCNKSLILRMAMCENPYPHEKAVVDAKKSIIFNDQAAQVVLKLLEKNGIINIGGEPNFIYDYVKMSKPNIGKIYLNEIKDVSVAKDSSMNIDKMKGFLQ
jgi:dTDP-4-dehydrorhamnose reductase